MSSAQEGKIYVKINSKGSTEDDGGHAWDDGPGGQVREILIWHGALVFGIQTCYERHGTTVLSQRHGGTRGDFALICFNEPLTCISGYYGPWSDDRFGYASEDEAQDNYDTVIRSLTFRASQETYGPFGEERGKPFCIMIGTGCSGFHGRAKDGDRGNLLAIGVYASSMAKSFIGKAPPSTATPF